MARLEIVSGHKNINDIDRPLKKRIKVGQWFFCIVWKDRKPSDRNTLRHFRQRSVKTKKT